MNMEEFWANRIIPHFDAVGGGCCGLKRAANLRAPEAPRLLLGSFEDRIEALVWLSLDGEQARAMLEQIVPLRTDPDDEIRYWAYRALSAAGSPAAPYALDVFLQWFEEGELRPAKWYERGSAHDGADALVNMGEAAEPALQRLRPYLTGGNDGKRMLAFQVFLAAGRHGLCAIDDVVEILGTRGPPISMLPLCCALEKIEYPWPHEPVRYLGYNTSIAGHPFRDWLSLFCQFYLAQPDAVTQTLQCALGNPGASSWLGAARVAATLVPYCTLNFSPDWESLLRTKLPELAATLVTPLARSLKHPDVEVRALGCVALWNSFGVWPDERGSYGRAEFEMGELRTRLLTVAGDVAALLEDNARHIRRFAYYALSYAQYGRNADRAFEQQLTEAASQVLLRCSQSEDPEFRWYAVRFCSPAFSWERLIDDPDERVRKRARRNFLGLPLEDLRRLKPLLQRLAFPAPGEPEDIEWLMQLKGWLVARLRKHDPSRDDSEQRSAWEKEIEARAAAFGPDGPQNYLLHRCVKVLMEML